MDESGTADRVDRAALSRRWRQEGRYEEIAEFRQQVKEATKKEWKAAGRQWSRDELNEVAWREAARAFPPLEPPQSYAHGARPDGGPQTSGGGDSARVQGLGDIPADWPDLPENASLQAELGWCQANRLRVVEESATSVTRVHLDRARSPAPSMAALGWLETSVRSYAKYVDVVARSLSVVADEQGMVRRERMKIERIRELLAEMREGAEVESSGAGDVEKS